MLVHVFGCEKFARKVGYQRQRIVQILLESYPDNSGNICIALEKRPVGLCSIGALEVVQNDMCCINPCFTLLTYYKAAELERRN